MRVGIIGILLVMAQVLESTLFQSIRIGDIGPNFIMMLIVSFALLRGSKEGTIIGIVAGLMYDSTFGLMMGPTTFSYAIIGWISGKFNKNFYRENYIIPLLCMLGGSLFYNFVNVMAAVLRGELHFGYYLNTIIVPEFIYTMAMSLIIYRLAYFINQKIEKVEKRSRNMFY